MSKKKHLAWLPFCLVLLLLLTPQQTDADFSDISIFPVTNLPQQNPTVASYFDLTLSDEKELKLVFRLQNSGKEKTTIYVIPANGITSSNGQIDFATHKETGDSVIDERYKLAPYIQTPESVTLSPNETKNITVTVKTPKERTGVHFGGVLFRSEPSNKDNQRSVQIEHIMQYAVSVQLNFGKQASVQSDDVNLLIKESKLEKKHDQYTILIPVTNHQARLFLSGKMTFELMNAKTEDVLESLTFPTFKMSPMSQINLSIPLQKTPETDNLTVKLRFDEYKNPIILPVDVHKDIDKNTLSADKSKKEKDTEPNTSTFNPLWVLNGLLLFIILWLLWLLARRKKSEEKSS